MLSTSDMLSCLLQALEEAAAQNQFLQLEPPLFLYHRGVYSNATSLWTKNPKALQTQAGRFDICAQLSDSLCLLVLNKQQWQNLCQHLAIGVNDTAATLNTFCELFNNSNLELPTQLYGFTCDVEDSASPPLMLLFKPLKNLLLYDIQDLFPDS